MDSGSIHQRIDVDEIDDELENKKEKGEGSQWDKSEVWNFFTRKGVGTSMTSICNGCGAEYKAGGRKGTTSLRRHMKKCNGLRYHEIGQMFIDHDGKLKTQKVDPMVARDLLAAAVIKHDLPFSFVEYDGIRAWQKYISPTLPYISRNSLVSDIKRLYNNEKMKLKKVLANIPHRVCLTSDVWTACTTEGYICLTAHFVDENWKLNSKILNFDHMPPPHSGVELAAKIFGFLKEWDIHKKVFSLTLDNASSNDTMQNILKEQLSLHNSLLCGGEYFHIRCSAHILNLIVQDGLKLCAGALHKIRESVKYVKGSESRMKKFEECVQSVGGIDSSVGLRLDVPTRWNSTFMMLESAIKYKKAFSSLPLHDRNYKWCPSNEEWKKGEVLCDFLEPFYETTNLISGSSYPTSNLYFMQVWKIEDLLKQNLLNEDKTISSMCASMLEKFDKYWSEYSIVLAFGAILDPRIKLQMLEYFYSRVESDSTKVQEKVVLVKSKLQMLFEEYGSTPTSSQSNSSPSLTPNQSGRTKSKGKRLFDEIKAFESRTITNTGKSQLDIYLDEPKLEFQYFEDLDVLDYWKKQKNRFPDLALIACDVLSIPISTVASESSFSIGARVLTKYRSCMLPENFQALICTRNWLHGFVASGTDDEDTKIKTTLSSEGSNVLEIIDEENEDDINDEMIEEL